MGYGNQYSRESSCIGLDISLFEDASDIVQN